LAGLAFDFDTAFCNFSFGFLALALASGDVFDNGVMPWNDQTAAAPGASVRPAPESCGLALVAVVSAGDFDLVFNVNDFDGDVEAGLADDLLREARKPPPPAVFTGFIVPDRRPLRLPCALSSSDEKSSRSGT